MTRTALLVILLCCVLSSPSLAGDTEPLKACSELGSHIEIRECLENYASRSAASLDSTENALFEQIAKQDQEPQTIARMRHAFEDERRDFKTFRDSHCEFHASLAAGGNGASDLRFACVARLNNERIKQLKDVLAHLQR